MKPTRCIQESGFRVRDALSQNAISLWLKRPKSIGAPGFEPGTSPTRTVRATGLRHAPNAPMVLDDRRSGKGETA